MPKGINMFSLDSLNDNYSIKNAIIDEFGKYTFSELKNKINDIAYRLSTYNSQYDYCSIFLPGSFLYCASIFACMKTGLPFIPIDPIFGSSRVNAIYDITKCLILTTSEYAHSVPIEATVILLDTIDSQYQPHLSHKVSPDSCMYCIFTSGSTGVPKGAKVPYSAYDNLINWYTEVMSINDTDIFMIPSSIAFDLTQKNIISPLIKGATIVFPNIYPFSPTTILETIIEHHVNKFNCTPSTLSLLVEEENHKALKIIDTIVLGGEQISFTILEKCIEINNTIRFLNSYGPTECSDVVSYCWITSDMIKGKSPISIGKAITNTELSLSNIFLDEQGRELGEITISGCAVGLGYIDKTLNSQFNIVNGIPSYLTGDIGYAIKGDYYYLSRHDKQIKLNGYLINLGEIEYHAMKQSKIHSAIADYDSEKGIIALFYKTQHAEIDILNELKMYLKEILPNYMIPTFYYSVKVFPLTTNNKIDMMALKNQLKNHSRKDDKSDNIEILPSCSIHHHLAHSLLEIAKIQSVELEESLHNIGLNSVHFIQLINKLNTKWKIQLSPREVFQLNTVEQLITLINQKIRKNDADLEVISI